MLVLPIAATSFKHQLLLSCHFSPCYWESFLEEPSGVPLMQLIQCWQWALLQCCVVNFFPKRHLNERQHKARPEVVLAKRAPTPRQVIILF